MRFSIHFVPLLGLGVGVAAALFGPYNTLEPNIQMGVRLNRLQLNFRQSWPVIIGAPVGAAFASGLAKGFGNPGVTVGPLSFKAF